jgi:hypothetical protein
VTTLETTRSTPSTSSRELHISKGERVFFGGRTGSGKTTLADRLIRKLGYRTVVVDPKHSWGKFPGYQLVKRYDPHPETLRQVFQPKDDAGQGWQDTVDFLSDVWGYDVPTVVYIDELTSVTTPRTAPRVLSTLVRLGRERGFGTWYSSQRPKDVPSLFFTEAEHWCVFDLLTQDDRDKVAGYMGDKVRDRLREKYSFWYMAPHMQDPLLVHQQQPSKNGG